ncbi:MULTISPECIES: hypothetical protein [unclassified Rhizobium]|uniref:hypothetical protein n=1 Tax=unclassified Rhizobium TaxID=2613769 RepID=UPI0007004A8E|nr:MULTISPECIES: hypothetical protein [unclassified Rhizobium]KQV38282.1 hypothetical protein ASC86_08665 [Rhizobium sp. Root1212]KRD30938.1 hypothetical protein ASE37_08660 [Rhizobium sp. Root268]
MRFKAAALLLLTTSLSPAIAADINYEGATALEKKLTTYLPENLVKDGLVKVRPGTEDYEVTFDPTVLLKDVDKAKVSISGLKPFLSLVRPLEDGLWRFVQDADLNVTGSFDGGPEKTDFTYRIDKMHSEGVVDPELLYFKSLDMKADGIAFASKTPKQTIDGRFAGMTGTLAAERKSPDTVDMRSNTTFGAFTESLTSEGNSRVDISADSLTGDVAIKDLHYKPLQEIVFFILDRADKEKLLPDEQKKLKELVRANLPMFGQLLETFELTNLKVSTPQGEFGAESARYSVTADGLRDGASFRIGFGIDKPTSPPDLVPIVYRQAIPESIDIEIGVKDIAVASGLTYFLDNANFNADEPLTEAQSAEMGKRFLPNGELHLTYENVSARSSIYDVTMTGSSTVRPDTPNKQKTDVTIVARDFDKTVAYLQDNAKAVPEYGQAAFMLLMIKGFGEATSDNGLRWHVEVDENSKIKINGRDMAFPQ